MHVIRCIPRSTPFKVSSHHRNNCWRVRIPVYLLRIVEPAYAQVSRVTKLVPRRALLRIGNRIVGGRIAGAVLLICSRSVGVRDSRNDALRVQSTDRVADTDRP
jgi:hypothetical protein